jgi:hypothetical protein
MLCLQISKQAARAICLITKVTKHEIRKRLRGNFEAGLNHHGTTSTTYEGDDAVLTAKARRALSYESNYNGSLEHSLTRIFANRGQMILESEGFQGRRDVGRGCFQSLTCNQLTN